MNAGPRLKPQTALPEGTRIVRCPPEKRGITQKRLIRLTALSAVDILHDRLYVQGLTDANFRGSSRKSRVGRFGKKVP